MRVSLLDLIMVSVVAGPVTVLPIGDRLPTLWFVDIAITLLTMRLLLTRVLVGNNRLKFTGAEPWYVLYLIIVLLTVFMTPDVLRFIVNFKLRLMPLLVLMIAYNDLQTRKDLRHAQIALALCGTGVAIMMLINAYIYSWGYAQLDHGVSVKEVAFTRGGRNNQLASVYTLLIPFSFSLFSIGKPILCFATTVTLISAVVVTQSRGGILTLIVGTIVWIAATASWKQKIKSLSWIIIILLLIVVGNSVALWLIPEAVFNVFIGRFERLWTQLTEDPDSISRVSRAKESFAAFLKAPLTGIGLGMQAEFSTGGRGASVHNLYIEMLTQTGLFSFLVYMIFLLMAGINIFRATRLFKTGNERVFASSVLASFIMALINAAIEPSYWGPQFSSLFAIVLAMGFAQSKIARQEALHTGSLLAFSTR